MQVSQPNSSCGDLTVYQHYVHWGMVAATGVPMKVDTELVIIQPIERKGSNRQSQKRRPGTVYHILLKRQTLPPSIVHSLHWKYTDNTQYVAMYAKNILIMPVKISKNKCLSY